ncbi:GNAT family N-acetyltransferase [Luteimonas sp BLCC-B24]|uniref:GNAT family N-acetyltransferase n=1 Tax=Luteimonas sp. BLCC-B24 TaxID=3025317 RepID=UPI00234CEDAC|nr:GNAT family N-acetyltransferase [Luteimonas sp. BLCC-B24]MDC7806306.1 GNAT family N-acetyltransferase [Luteimonas sp. BLCC-B24]
MSDALRIRPAQPADRAALVAIYARAKLDELAHEPVVPALVPLPQDRARLATLDASEIFVACAACVLGFGARTTGRITMLFVDPAARGAGIGAALLRHMLAGMAGAVELDVVASNAAALALYRRAGFVHGERGRAVYNGVAVDVLRLRRPA